MHKIRFTQFAEVSLILLALVATGCSSSKTADDAELEDLPVADSGTDAVPMDGSELDAAPVADGELTDNAEPAEPVQTGDYVVREGDTLMKIAFEVYGDLYQWRRIYEANRDRINNPNALNPGTSLAVDRPTVPPQIDRNGQSYLIKSGDTLGTISNDVYGTPSKWKALWENNQQLIKDPNKIYAGFTLYYRADGTEGQSTPLATDGAAPAAVPAAEPAPTGDTAATDDLSIDADLEQDRLPSSDE